MNPGDMRCVDNIGLNHQVFVKKLSRISVISVDAADLGGGQYYMVDFVLLTERIDGGLLG